MTALELNQSPCLEWSVAAATFPGQSRSGDLHVVLPRDDGALVAVVDGVGHGEEAAAAAAITGRTLERYRDESVISLARRCHAALIGTRGVAMSLARFGVADDTMTWLAIGNVDGVLVRNEPGSAPAREAVIMRGGVIGSRLPPLQATVVAVAPRDMLVFATDGIRPGFSALANPAHSPQKVADAILTAHAKDTDDALVLAVRYLGRAAEDS